MRAILRHRGNAIAPAASHGQRVRNSLDRMGLYLHPVIGGITGQTGLAVLYAGCGSAAASRGACAGGK